MFLLSAQSNSYIVSSSYVEGNLKQNLSLYFMLNFGWFPALQNLGGFWKTYCGTSFKSFSGRNNFLKPPVLGFSNSFPYSLEESTDFSSLD